MRRLQLFEFEDFAWVPSAIRDGGTDLLDLLFERTGFYKPLAKQLSELMKAGNTRTLVDVCSGGGGGALAMYSLLKATGEQEVTLTLTERHPNAAAIARVTALGDGKVQYHPHSVDALAVPTELGGSDTIRTMYGALHHFPPEMVRELIASAVKSRTPLAFFDIAASPMIRKAPIFLWPILALPNMLMLTLMCLLMVPLVRPFRLSRLLLTYVIPAIPLLFAWDGTASALRAYTTQELLELAQSVPESDSYQWTAEQSGPGLCLVGRPKA